MLNGIFVDDQPKERQYAELLEQASGGKVTVVFMAPDVEATKLAEQLIAANLGFVALDFRLDEVPVASNDGSVPNVNRYKASAVAQQLRDRVIDDPKLDIPLVLLSQEDNITTMYSKDTTALDLFDLVLKKEVLTEAKPSEEAAQQILSIASAYQAIKANLGAEKMVAALCRIDEQKEGYVLEHQAIRGIDKLGFAHQVVPKIRKLLIDQPGILVSKEHLLARLGVAPDSASIEELFKVLDQAGATYDGILAEGWPRWWWHRVEAWVREVIGDTPGSLVGSERVSRLNKALGLSLTAAKSRWSNSSEEYFWAACSCCGQPIELDHTVLAYSENYPPFLDPQRICWKCIQTGASNFEIDDADSELVKKIQSGQLVE
jgi:hypothetical protein